MTLTQQYKPFVTPPRGRPGDALPAETVERTETRRPRRGVRLDRRRFRGRRGPISMSGASCGSSVLRHPRCRVGARPPDIYSAVNTVSIAWIYIYIYNMKNAENVNVWLVQRCKLSISSKCCVQPVTLACTCVYVYIFGRGGILDYYLVGTERGHLMNSVVNTVSTAWIHLQLLCAVSKVS